MGRTPTYYKTDTCECGGIGCNDCTCENCGDWLTVSNCSICDECIEEIEKENN